MHQEGQNDPQEVAVFKYSENDFEDETNTWTGGIDFELSKFDKELLERWDTAMKMGIFRYTIDHFETRIVPGPKHYVAQLSVERARLRRKPQELKHVKQAFNPDNFNFTKIGQNEVIFNLKHVQPNKVAVNGVVEGEEDERHMLIINASPMERGHCLFVPFINQCMPQIFTKESVKLVLEMLLLSKHRGVQLGFNSMCGLASVNHLHYHIYYLEYELVTQYCPVTHLAGTLHEITTIPVPGFAFQLHGSNLDDLARDLYTVSSYFQEKDIAHNLHASRGVIFGESQDAPYVTLRVYIWPRTKCLDASTWGQFVVACVELAGHVPIRIPEGYHELTENMIDTGMARACLPADQYEEIKRDLTNLFSPTQQPGCII